MRKYEAETGRFTSIDPLWGKYYGWTPYQYSMNSPVMLVDVGGELVQDNEGNFKYTTNGQTAFYEHNGTSVEMEVGWVHADDGTKIEALRNKSGNENFNTNCHGTTFTNGQLWINDDQVENILIGDSYFPVLTSTTDAIRKGDAVIYYGADNKKTKIDENAPGKPFVNHSEKVVGVSSEGKIRVKGLGGQQKKETEKDINNPSAPGDLNIYIFRK